MITQASFVSFLVVFIQWIDDLASGRGRRATVHTIWGGLSVVRF